MKPHALVIGGGVAGLSTAWTLLQRGYAVTVLERGALGGESSWAGGGILFPLLPWDYEDAVTALALRSIASYDTWLAPIEAAAGREAEFWRCGMLVVDTARRDDATKWCTSHGLGAETRCPEHLPLEKALCTRDPLWLPEVAQLRNPRLLAALRSAVELRGGAVREQTPATAMHHEGSRVTGVDTPAGELGCDLLVLATGAWSGLDIAGLGVVPGIRPIRGQMVLFKLAPGVLDTIIYRNGLYLIPRRDGHVLVGSTLEDVGFDKRLDDTTCERLHAEAAALLPQLAHEQPSRRWAGLRPGAPGNLPVIDRHPDFENVFVNTGHFRYGVTMAPASSELLADLIEGTAPALDPTPYAWQAALERRWPEQP